MAVALMLGWSPAPVAAQATGTLVGTVRDAASQRPLEAVQVYIGGTGIGALTNSAGRFLLLNVPAGQHSLVAELVGYRAGASTVTVGAGQSVVSDFGLEQTAISLDQIVVTGAGIATEKRKLGNTIATLDARSLENAPINSFSQMIAAREPGVSLMPSSGYTGEGASIRIRGSASLSQLNEPIIYVDGIRVDSRAVELGNDQGNPSRLDDIPPESIDRIEILKGAAAATLYGTEASNGVIQVFTKRGRAGAPRFTAAVDYTGISMPTNRILPVADYMGRLCEEVDCTGVDDAATLAEAGPRLQERFAGFGGGTFEPFEEDFLPDLFGTGFGQNYSASVSGGSELFTYFVSARMNTEDGPYAPEKNFPADPILEVEKDSNRRVGLTSNFTVVPNQKIRIGVNTLYSDMEAHTPDNGNNIYGVYPSALMSQLRQATTQAEPGLFGSNYYGQTAFATLRENMYQLNFANSQHFAGSANVGFTPTDKFRLDGTFGVDFTSDDRVEFRPYGWNVDDYSASTPEGSRTVNEARSRELTADLKGSYISTFGDNIENTFLFGGQGFMRQRQNAGGEGSVFPGPGLETLDALASENSFEDWTRVTQLGGYLQDQVGLNDWIFMTVGGRWDANSAFGESFSTAFYPKASVSIVPSMGLDWTNETFSTFRVRGAIGQSGLQPDAFAKFTTYQPRPSTAGPGIAPDNLGNEDLKPEVSTEWEVGAELGLFNDRWSVDATYWDRSVADAMVNRQFSVTGGFTEQQLVNIGEVTGNGVELGVRGTVLQQEGLSLNVFANTAYLNEKVTSMGGAPPLKTGGSYPRYRNYIVEGWSPGRYFGAKLADVEIPLNMAGPDASNACQVLDRATALTYFQNPINPSDFKPLAQGNSDFGKPIAGKYASNNCGEGLLLSDLGKATPDFAGSFGFNLAFAMNFELSTLFEYKLGVQGQDLSGMFRRASSGIGRNTPRSAELSSIMANPLSTADMRLDAAIAWAREIEALSPMSGLNGIDDADMMRWRELSLTYRIPADIVGNWGLSTATVNVGARNLHLFVFGDYRGQDPELNVQGRCNGGLDCNFLAGTEAFNFPIPRRFTLSTRVTF